MVENEYWSIKNCTTAFWRTLSLYLWNEFYEWWPSESGRRKNEKHSANAGVRTAVLCEINSGREEQKGGIMPEDFPAFFAKISEFPHVDVRGIMTMAPNCENIEDYRKYFRETYNIFIDFFQKKPHNIGRIRAICRKRLFFYQHEWNCQARRRIYGDCLRIFSWQAGYFVRGIEYLYRQRFSPYIWNVCKAPTAPWAWKNYPR